MHRLAWIGLLVWWLVLLGLILPWLLSSSGDAAGPLGFVVLFASAFLTFRAIRAHATKDSPC